MVTDNLEPIPGKRLAKHSAQIVPNGGAVQIVRKDLLRGARVEAVGALCHFDGNPPGHVVAAHLFPVDAAYRRR